MGMYQFLATCFVEHSKLNLRMISVPSCFAVTQGIFPNTTWSSGKKAEHKKTTRKVPSTMKVWPA